MKNKPIIPIKTTAKIPTPQPVTKGRPTLRRLLGLDSIGKKKN